MSSTRTKTLLAIKEKYIALKLYYVVLNQISTYLERSNNPKSTAVKRLQVP